MPLYVHDAVIMTKVSIKVHPIYLINVLLVLSGCRLSDQANLLGL